MVTYKRFKKIFVGFIFVLFFILLLSFSSILNYAQRDLLFMFDASNFYSVCCVSSIYDDETFYLCNMETSSLKLKKVVNTGNKNFLYLDMDYIDFGNTKVCKSILSCNYIEFKSKNLDYVKNVLKKFDAKLILQESVNESQVDYYSVSFLDKYKMLGIYKVNLQIVWQQDECIIGYPMIYTAY